MRLSNTGRAPLVLLGLSLILTLSVRPTSADVVINEVHYNGEPNTAVNEFVELYNTASNSVDVSGWYFDDGIEYTLPPATTIAGGGYLVIAERPSSIQSEFGVSALGPYIGGLSRDGERVRLKDASGVVVDEVDYRSVFPWPVGANGSGASMELVNPFMDNDLGGSWRTAGVTTNAGGPDITYLAPQDTGWRYRKGNSEASSPIDAWRAIDFVEDGTWIQGQTSIGYSDGDDNTIITDMSGSYWSLYFRNNFTVNPGEMPSRLVVRLYIDDGGVVWINGNEVLRAFVPPGELAFNAQASNHEAGWVDVIINDPASILVEGDNIVAAHGFNSSLGSSDFSFDVEIRTPPAPPPARNPTPGKVNSAFADNAPPQTRQVNHTPKQPLEGESAVISAKVTDTNGVASVTLQYQLVAPGAYIPARLAKSTSTLLGDPNSPNDANPAYEAGWVSVPMLDTGANGDEVAGDDTYTTTINGQPNRTLVRYRIIVTDSVGASVRVPYEDDDSLNFAYFVYNGVPDYVAGTRSILGAPYTHPASVITSVPVYHLITDPNDFDQAVAYSGGNQIPRDNYDARRAYNWGATFVYDGVVHDNIGYRLRQRNARYSGSGKRSFKFRFNRGNYPHFRDMDGEKYVRPWSRLSSHKMTGSRGNHTWGMWQTANHILFNSFKSPASYTHWFHLRVVRGAEEAPSGSNGQYLGDYYGMLLAFEEFDVDFLQSHGLQPGNVYKLISGLTDGVSVRRYLEKNSVDDGSDFQNIIFNLRANQPDSWLLDHVNYEQWYHYHTVLDAVRTYDMEPNTGEHLKNRAYYFEPAGPTQYGRLWLLPWDSDTSWGPNWNGGNDFCKRAVYDVVNDPTPRPSFDRDYKNVVREFRDIAWTEEQLEILLDSLMNRIKDIVPADRDRWEGGVGGSQNDPPIENVVADMKRFAFVGGSWVGGSAGSMDSIARDDGISGQQGRDAFLDALGNDPLIPSTPVITATGPGNFPVNRLTFQTVNYSGIAAFAAWKWRIAEITTTNDLPLPPNTSPKLEIVANFESPEIPDINNREFTFPADAVRANRTYRVRARAKDINGRWSHWSAPIQFTSSEPDSASIMLASLRVTELMFHSPAGGEFDYVELHNTSGDTAVELNGAKFTAGIDHTFGLDDVIPPGGYLVLVNTTNHAAFRAHYGIDAAVPLAGPYGGNLSNNGEEVTLRTSSGGTDIATFEYNDGRGWPVPADGTGHSLVPRVMDDQSNGALNYGGNWRASTYINGSPGSPDPDPADVVVINEVAAHTDFPLPPPEDSNDWIELHNTGASTFTFGTDWYLSDDAGATNLTKWMIPAGTQIPAGGFISFDERSDFNNPVTAGFGLNKAGERVLLSYLPGTAEDRVVDSVRFKGQENDWSLGRFPDGGDYWHALTPRTQDAANTAPLLHVSISELMYHPPDLAGGVDDTFNEFIEIYNPTANAVSLFNTNGAWRLDGGVEFTFPNNAMLGAMARLLVVSFDPADTAAANAFRAAYGIVDPTLPLFGPYNGKLNNSSERVAIEKPQAPDAPEDSISWIIVDEVIYGDRAPWEQGADGIGPSLQRQDFLVHGNDPANWRAAAPTPWTAYLGGTPPSITIQPSPSGQVVSAGSQVTYSVSATGTAPLSYQWLLNGSAIPGANSSVLAISFAQPVDSGNYSVVVLNPAGSVVSDSVTLQVTTPPMLLSALQDFKVREGTNVTFSITASGAGTLAYEWRRNGELIAGATGPTLDILNVQESDGGLYTVSVSDTNGVVVSDPGVLTVLINPEVLVPPLSQSAVVGDTVTLSIVTRGTLPMSYRWRRSFFTLKQETLDSSVSFLTISNVQLSDAGAYTVVLTNEAFFTPGVLSPAATLTVLDDTDLDGMPDIWETDNGLNPNDPADALVDTDLDGLINRDEYKVGTDPNDALSLLRIETIEADKAGAGTVRLTFPAVANRTYSVLFRDAFGIEPWGTLENVPAAATNRIVEIIDVPFGVTDKRYYQLVYPKANNPL